jgi:hypothetical protein
MATLGGGDGKIMIRGQPGQKYKTLSQNKLKQKGVKSSSGGRVWGPEFKPQYPKKKKVNFRNLL